jgi:hypothetical protein
MRFTFLLAFIVLACQQQQTPQSAGHSESEAVTDTLQKKGSVSGCADPSRAATKARTDAFEPVDPDLPLPGISSIRAGGDSVGYERFVRHGCCRLARISSSVNDDVITFTEYWWGQICKCMCQSTLRGRVGGLKPGTYRVYVVETGTDIITDRPDPGRDTVLYKTIEIR